MRICIFGAGAIGGYIGAELAGAGAEVTLIARGAHLAAIRARGLKVIDEEGERVVRPPATDRPEEAGAQDYVIVTLKANAVPALVERFVPLFDERTAVVTAANGIPWWYFYKLPGRWENRRVESVDPAGRQWEVIGPERAIGCVVYPAAELVEPGVIKVMPHLSAKRLPIGEPDGTRSERCLALSKVLIEAGFKAPVRRDIRSDIWVKLWGNLAFNPISALTGATLAEITGDPRTRALARDMMREGQAVGERLGARLNIDVETRIKGAAGVGAHKTSMLQDLERGRPLEIDALVASVIELGALVGVPTPLIEAVYALVRQRAELAGCYVPPTPG